MKKIGTVTAVLACACTSLLSGITAARFIRRTQKQQRLEVRVPEGELVVYPSGDPDYPGVHIELKKNDIPYMLNLTTVEYNKDKSDYITHVWGDALKEDTTHEIHHTHVSEYFDETREDV